MHLHLLLLSTFLYTALAQGETLRNDLAGLGDKGIDQLIADQPNQQPVILSNSSSNNDANRRSGRLRLTNLEASKPIGKIEPFLTDKPDIFEEDDYDSGEEQIVPTFRPPLKYETPPNSLIDPYPAPIKLKPTTEPTTEDPEDTDNSDTIETTSPKGDDYETTVSKTIKPETNRTTTIKTPTSSEPAHNSTTTPKPKPTGNGKSIWRSPLVIWIAIIVLAIIVLAVQMPTILYLLCCRNQTQTSEVLLSDGKDFQRPLQAPPAQSATQQQFKSSAAMPTAPMAYNSARPQTTKKYLPILGVQQQQKQNDTAAMSDAFGTSMSEAESGFANAPATSAVVRAKAQQMLPKISYTASSDQKMSSKNQAGRSKRAAARK